MQKISSRNIYKEISINAQVVGFQNNFFVKISKELKHLSSWFVGVLREHFFGNYLFWGKTLISIFFLLKSSIVWRKRRSIDFVKLVGNIRIGRSAINFPLLKNTSKLMIFPSIYDRLLKKMWKIQYHCGYILINY